MREASHLPQTTLNEIMRWTTLICQDSVLLAGERIQRQLENMTPPVDCDMTDCLRLVFTSDGVGVRVVIRSAEQYDLVKIKSTELEEEYRCHL